MSGMNRLNTYVERKEEAKYSEMKTPYSPQWVSEKKTMKNDIWRRSKSFCIWMYMMKYDGYHKEMLFKVLCMQSKLGKHWQWNDKWRNKSENMKQFKNDILLSFSSASAALRISDFACVFLLMFWTRIRCKNLKNQTSLNVFYDL